MPNALGYEAGGGGDAGMSAGPWMAGVLTAPSMGCRQASDRASLATAISISSKLEAAVSARKISAPSFVRRIPATVTREPSCKARSSMYSRAPNSVATAIGGLPWASFALVSLGGVTAVLVSRANASVNSKPITSDCPSERFTP